MSQKKDLNIIWNLRAIPIERVLSYYKVEIPPYTVGKPYKVFCPFHGETNPSFTVYTDNNSFYCFSCTVGGDSINLIREKEGGIRFLPALQILAKIGGYDLPAELFVEIAQSFGGVWQDVKKTREVFEARRKEDWKKLTIKMSKELSDLHQSFPNWKLFRETVDWIWDEYDAIILGEMTMKRFDDLKDWYRKSKRFITKQSTHWIELEKFKREVYEERVGFVRNRPR